MYEIITHGGGEVLWSAFNSIALLFQKTGVMGGLLYIAFNLSIIVATTQMVITQDSIRAFKWAFLSLFVINALLLPKVNVIIIDRAALYDKKVDNVPFILGFTASFTSKMGEFLAKKFDAIFAPPGLEYSTSGVAMASKLVSKSAYMTVHNPDVAENYKEFVRNCLMIDLVRGKYTANEFYNAEDTWEFLAKTSSPIRGFPYKNPLGQTKILTCQEVAAKEKDFWKYHIKTAGRYFGFNVLQSAKDPLEALMTYIPISYEYLTGISQDATLTLRQAIMRNLIRDSVVSINANNPEGAEVARSIAATRAQEQQKNTYALHGDTASLSLSTLKVLFEVLIYALFPIAATIALFPGGLRIAKEYFIMMFSIQMWAPMYAVLNMVLNVMARYKSMAAVTVVNANGELSRVISYGTLPKLAEANEWIAAVAGYGMGLIPFLAYGLFRYGAGALTQISSHFGSVSQSALGSAADTKTTGNMGLGNRTFDVHSQSNVTAMKYDTNTSVAAGKTTMQELDGAQSNLMADGSYTLNRDAAISKLGATLNVSEGISGSSNESAEINHRAGMQQTQQAMESRSAALQQFIDAKQQRSQDIASGETFTANDSVFQESGLAKNYKIAEDISKQWLHNEDLALKAVAGMRAQGSAGLDAGILKAQIMGYLEIQGSYGVSNSEKADEIIKYMEENQVSKNWKQAESEAKEGRYSTTDSSHKAFGNGITASLNNAISQQKMASASFSEEEAYRKSAQVAENLGASFNQDMSQVFLDRLIKERGIEEAKRITSNPDLLRREASGFIRSEAESIKHMIKNSPEFKFDASNIKEKHQNNVSEVQSSNNVDKTFSEDKAAVDNNIDHQLKNPISNDVKERVDKRTSEINKVMSEESINEQKFHEKVAEHKKMKRRKYEIKQSYEDIPDANIIAKANEAGKQNGDKT